VNSLPNLSSSLVSKQDHWSSEVKQDLEEIAKMIRGLSIDAVEKAKSGHPGLPLGCASLAAYLYGFFLNHYPQVSEWIGRDRFILSAGHGSMLLYSSLHLSGFNLSLDQLKLFRQLHSQTPGHPEFRHTEGVETTTGPLGQGLAVAAGQALGLKMALARLDHLSDLITEPKIIALAGDGCMMEGISHETGSFAAHMGLNNLIVIYDSNDVCLDGPLSECFSENVQKRFEAYGWDVFEIDGHNLENIHQVLSPLKIKQDKPVLVIAKTTIGFGAPHKQGTHEAHGSPLGQEEANLTRKALGLPEETFYVSDRVKSYFTKRLLNQKNQYLAWLEQFDLWSKTYPQQAECIKQALAKDLPANLEQTLIKLNLKASMASRNSSQAVLNELSHHLPWLVGGSADLSCSDNTFIKEAGVVKRGHYEGRNIKYGVREFAMAALASGIFHSHFFVPFIGTFLTFSDYMRNAIRLCSLMGIQVIYQFTHDSVFLGEDGPTHQPIEHLAALRIIPGLQVIRPADSHEVKMAWLAALKHQGPTALVLSRQALPDLPAPKGFIEGLGRGAYLVKDQADFEWTLFATGSEVSLALEVANWLEQNKHVRCRVVSMPCHYLFDKQPEDYKRKILGPSHLRKLSLEAATTFGWHKYIGQEGLAIGIDEFGASAPIQDLKQLYGFTIEKIAARMGYTVGTAQ
jgi:transketolase